VSLYGYHPLADSYQGGLTHDSTGI